MTTWVTSDTHFGHRNILKYQAHTRPFKTVDLMDEALIERWNKHIKPTDHVYHLGDFAFSSATRIKEILTVLNGKLHMVMGNHDGVLRRDSLQEFFVWQKDYAELTFDGHKICMFHYPIREWNRSHHGSIHLHGHLHSVSRFGRSMDVGCDSNNCFPYNMRDVVDDLTAEEIVSEYHEVRETEK